MMLVVIIPRVYVKKIITLRVMEHVMGDTANGAVLQLAVTPRLLANVNVVLVMKPVELLE